MREKLMTLPLKELQQIAKANHIRYAGVRKAELVDRLCSLEEEQGEGRAERHDAEQREAEQSGTEPGTAEFRRTEQNETGLSAAERDETEPRKPEQSRTELGERKLHTAEQSGTELRESKLYDAEQNEKELRDVEQRHTAQRDLPEEEPEESDYEEDVYTSTGEIHPEYTDPADELQKSYAASADQSNRNQYTQASNDRESYVRTSDAQAVDDQRSYPRNTNNRTTGDQTRNSQTTYSRNSYNRTTYDQTRNDQTTYSRNSNGQRSYGQSANDQSTYMKNPDTQSSYTQSSYGQESDAQVPANENRDATANPPRRTRTFSYESDEETCGILEIMQDGYGFIRCHNYLPGEEDVYVAPSQIRKFNLKTGDFLRGKLRVRREGERFGALAFLEEVNNASLAETVRRTSFEDLTPVFPDERIYLETSRRNLAMRIVDIVSPVGKGQRGMIVSPPKAGKTTLLKEIARSVTHNYPDIHLIILLIDERPEEVTDIREAIQGDNVEVIYSTFDELPDHHKRVSEMAIERAKRLVEQKKDVMVLLDSITRLARAYNLTVAPSGRTLSGGLDPAALYMPKKFFGAARNIREGGSLTILATALIETGSRMDDMIFEEFKGTGNMELVLDRRLSERRVFPAIDLLKSGTRRDDLIMTREEKEASDIIRRLSNATRQDDMLETVMNLFYQTRDNQEFIKKIKVTRL